MALFSPKESYLGVDIGTASIKIVELAPLGGKPKLVTYGYIDIASDIVHSRSAQTQQIIAVSLKKLLQKAKVGTSAALAALPTFSVFNSIISLPPMSAKDLGSAVKWEAKKYVPMPLEEMILDWKLIDGAAASAAAKNSPKITPAAAKPKDLRILVTAAPKTLVNRYLEIFRAAGLKLMSLETEAFALARSLIGADKSTVLVVDIGSITTDICIIENSLPILNRSIDVGGLIITKAIAASLNINLDRAEQFKRDYGLSLSAQDAQKGINKTIATSLSPIINEIKYVFDLYQNQENRPVEKMILSGGSAFLPNLAQYFQQLFNKPVFIGNPWDKVIYPTELKPVLDEVGSRLAVAIGLAMRDIK
ncbi:MAG: type IV pilus assembly protein PilM [Candidatus Komeilibacteria bacterium]|nr:type IV pilus assembly protein PilM [Candidatus Komeilibacteria bacterium]